MCYIFQGIYFLKLAQSYLQCLLLTVHRIYTNFSLFVADISYLLSLFFLNSVLPEFYQFGSSSLRNKLLIVLFFFILFSFLLFIFIFIKIILTVCFYFHDFLSSLLINFVCVIFCSVQF